MSITILFLGMAFCLPQEEMVEYLAQKFEETRIGWGHDQKNGIVVQLFRSRQGTWSLVVTPPGGLSCIRQDGVNWHTLEFRKPDTKS